MKANNKKANPYLRIILCALFIGIWIMLLTNSLEKKKSTKISKERTKGSIILLKKEDIIKVKKANIVACGEPRRRREEERQAPKNDLPKLANLTGPTTSAKHLSPDTFAKGKPASQQPSQKNESDEMKSVENKEILSVAKLREKAPVDKTRLKPILKKVQDKSLEEFTDEEFQESWIPKYITESQGLTSKIKNVSNNLDQIANQLELAGLFNTPNGQSAAIIRNKSNNKIQILKPGEEYLGLKVLEVKNNEIILGNQDLNKKYVKKIVAVKQQ